MSVEESTQETTATATATTSTNSPVIVSPFDTSGNSDEGARSVASTTTKDEYLDLTWDNVELVLDGLRCYLIQDGGNVIISEIDGPVVKLELQGACGTCPSSTQTLKMGCVRLCSGWIVCVFVCVCRRALCV